MLARSIPSRALVQSRLAPAGAASLRRLTTGRPSAVALGKRPVAPPRAALLLGSVGAARSISWTPWKSSAPAAEAAVATPEAAAAAPTVPAATPSAETTAPTADLSTPLPSSDIPSTPAEHALPAAQHLTSTAPDHQFHSDPTPLLPQPPANAATPTLEDLVTNSGLPLEQVLNSPEAVHAAIKVSDLKLIGLEHGIFNIAGWLQEALVGMHTMTGLPWWASIAALTLTMRFSMVGLVIKNLKHNVRMAAVSPQFQGLMKRMTEAKTNNDQLAQATAAANLQKLMKDNDVSPLRPLMMPLIQMPFFLGMFFGLRKLAQLPLPQLKEGGFSWVTDLTVPDPLFILPITSILFQILVFRVGVDGTGASSGAKNSRQMAHFRNFFIMTSPLMIYMISGMPSAVLFYWTTSNFFTLSQAWVLRHEGVRRVLGVQKPPVVEAPPNDAVVNTNPGLGETLSAMRDWHQETLEKFTQMRGTKSVADKLAAEREMVSKRETRAGAIRPGTALLTEKVQEGPRKQGGFLEDKPAEVVSEVVTGETTGERDPAEEKRRRVLAARIKRQQQAREARQ